MEAAAKGAKEAGGVTIGILPNADYSEANEYIELHDLYWNRASEKLACCIKF